MISFKEIRNGTSWSGVDWLINDRKSLARLIARVALGQQRSALKVLNNISFKEFKPQQTALQGAIDLLSVPKGRDSWHRDGWMFQVIAWISASLQDPSSLKSSPHMRHADKGFDGIQLKINPRSQRIEKVVLCEEKATLHPRGKIKSQVWPEFKEMESGKRDNELISAIIEILEKNSNSIDPDEAVAAIFWPTARSYRISITIDDKHRSDENKNALFMGYEKIVKGTCVDRRAETLHCKDLRAWMANLAEMAIVEAKGMA